MIAVETLLRDSLKRLVPFADAASDELPLGRLLRLSLFQVSIGLTMVLLTGTLNRVIIVELGVPAGIVAVMMALPLVIAPLRLLIGFRSDTYRSFLGLRRLPYLAMGTMLQYGGLAIMPFALLILAGDSQWPVWTGKIAAGLAFLVAGAGVHICQTAGLALAADISPETTRPRVVALLHVMLLVGMVASAIVLSALLVDVTPVRLIQVIQGAAVAVMLLNTVALWKQEPRQPHLTRPDVPPPSFRESWSRLAAGNRPARLLLVVALGSAAFSMQDILLEPYGGEVLGLSVGATTMLTALLALGSLAGFGIAAGRLGRGGSAYRIAAAGIMVGIVAFTLVIISGAAGSTQLFRAATALIGLGSGLFAVGTLTAAMALATRTECGLAVGAWGAVQATATGFAMGSGGVIRDVTSRLAHDGALGPALGDAAAGYAVVYHIEILLLFVALAAIGPLFKRGLAGERAEVQPFGLSELPG
jgi:BCD family chlorophyll transporter-like MFS transporter